MRHTKNLNSEADFGAGTLLMASILALSGWIPCADTM